MFYIAIDRTLRVESMQHVDLMVGNYLEHFSLSRDPFEPAEAFFSGAGRQLLLGQLLHLSQFSSAVLVVSGALGSGRTCFSKKYAREAETWSDCVCFIDVAELHQPDELFTQLSEAYGLQLGEDVKSGELLVAIRQAVQQQELVLICDGAELLDDRVLSALLSLLQGPSDQSPLRVLLTGDEELVARLDAFGMLDVLVQDWQLEAFSKVDIAQYLSFLLASAGNPQEGIFSADELERLWQLSDGLPGRVQLPARELLMDKALQAVQVSGRPEQGVSVWYLGAAACCAAFLLMAFLYRADWGGAPGQGVRGADLGPVAVVGPVGSSPQQLTPLSGVAEVLLVNEGGAGKQGAELGEVDATVVSAAPLAAEVLPSRLLKIEEVFKPALPLPPAEALFYAPEVEPVVNAESSSSVVALEPLRVEGELGLAERHLMSLDESHFVLQVLGAASRASVEQFVAAQANSRELYVFVTERGGKPWYTVVVGDYPSRTAAQIAIKSLPNAQRMAGVWPRPVGDVHSKIGESRGL